MISLTCEILKNKINKQNKNQLIDTENKVMVAGGEAVWGSAWKRTRD